jgi:hypothetical protein
MQLSRASSGFVATIAAVALCLAIAHPVEAAEGLAKENGTRLREVCAAAQALLGGETLPAGGAADAALCLGFLEGFAWGHGWAAWRRGRDMYFCPPEKFSYRDALPAVMSYLADHPERLDADAHILVFSALSTAFPCTP